MPRSSISVQNLPEAARRPLETFGAHLRIARERRGESLRNAALRMGVSVPTLRRMEAGDPTVSMGVFATALWLFDRADQLEDLLRPEQDDYAMRIDIDRASRSRK
jgi:transcriptional regulator with XRE-family HTH domain